MQCFAVQKGLNTGGVSVIIMTGFEDDVPLPAILSLANSSRT